MRLSEIFRLVILNLSQNKFKVILTSIGISVGSATIMMVIAIWTGGKEEVAEQFKNLNAGSIDIRYEASTRSFGGMSFAANNSAGGMTMSFAIPDMSSGASFGRGNKSDMMGGNSFANNDNRMNQESVTLTVEDMEDLTVFVPGITDATIS